MFIRDYYFEFRQEVIGFTRATDTQLFDLGKARVVRVERRQNSTSPSCVFLLPPALAEIPKLSLGLG